MATKQEELNNSQSCFNKAAHHEPIFVLRATDPLAPAVVGHWAYLVAGTGLHSDNDIVSAQKAAKEMRAWRKGPLNRDDEG